jgi:nucleoporin NUP82
VHIAILPDASHLAAGDRSPLKLKSHQLGPTTHVLPQSPVISALWHPLACSTTSSDCLVTVTAEAAVRVWELERSNTWSFDRPSLAIDLQKLVDGTSCDEDFEPSGFGKGKGFSADAFEMEVSAACFGGHGREEEDGWASMTLWIAMRNADVYALCPLLPSKWRPTSTLIPSLSTSVVSKLACIEDDSVEPDDKRAVQQQLEWVQEIDSEEPVMSSPDSELSFPPETRSRPMAPSAIPRLQGPFLFDLEENELDIDVSDIHVIAAKVNAEDLLSGEEEDYIDLEGLIQDRLSATVICLATTTGKVHVCLEMEGVAGQWLPKTKKGAFTIPVGEPKDLTLVESVELGHGEVGSENWPLFSEDPLAPYDFYLTSKGRVNYLSLSAWASRIESELLSPTSSDTGMGFRVKVLCGDDIILTEEVLDCSDGSSQKSSEHFSSALVMHTSEFGYFLLTCSASGPHAVTFDTPDTASQTLILARARNNSLTPNSPNAHLDLMLSSPEIITASPRATYEPSSVFYESATAPLKQFMSANVPQRHRAALKQEIRLSPSTLDIMTAAHRIFSSQTSQFEQAAAELFRRCDRLREELGDQVRQMAELSERIQRNDLSAEDASRDRNSRCENRIAKARDRQQSLSERYELLRRKVGRATAGGRELTNKEKAWISEITSLGESFGVDSEMEVDVAADAQPDKNIDDRFEMVSGQLHILCLAITNQILPQVRNLAESLLSEAKEIQQSQKLDPASSRRGSLPRPSSSASSMSRTSNLGVPPKLQKAKIEEAMRMVEREAAVINAVMVRLERLS